MKPKHAIRVALIFAATISAITFCFWMGGYDFDRNATGFMWAFLSVMLSLSLSGFAFID